MSLSYDPTKNTFVEYEIASAGSRIAATLIDWAILGIISGLLYSIASAMGARHSTRDAIGTFAIVPIWLFYDLICEIALHGQTPGKKIMKIQVQRLDGTEPDLGQYFIRWIIKIVDRGLIALLAVSMGGKGQRLGDMAAKTRVVDLRSQRIPLEGTIFDAERQN